MKKYLFSMLLITGLVFGTATANISPPDDDIGYELIPDQDTPTATVDVHFDASCTPIQTMTIQMEQCVLFLNTTLETSVALTLTSESNNTSTTLLKQPTSSCCVIYLSENPINNKVSWYGTNYFRIESRFTSVIGLS